MRVNFKKRLSTVSSDGNNITAGTKNIKTDDDWRTLGFKISQFALANEIKKVEYRDLPKNSNSFIEGCELGDYTYSHKTDKKSYNLQITYSGKISKKDITHAESIVEAMTVTKDLVNTPPNIANSMYILDKVRNMFKGTEVKVGLYTESELSELNMRGHLAVNAGSKEEAMTIKLTYEPKNYKKHHIFVGKGLTYDSGGLSIKPTGSMVNMQADKAGAMTVLGLMKYLATEGSDNKVSVYLALAENMINEYAYRPGDILTMKNKKTVIVNNTDAEGRIVLFDNLCLAQEENKKFDTITSIATLTGAAVYQFGDEAAALVSYNDKLKRKIQKIGTKSGEIFMDAQFHKYMMNGIHDTVADISNTGTPGMGCQKAGLFLTESIKKKNKNKFIHIDIAGPAFIDKPFGSNPKGATGFGVRTLIEFVSN